MTATATAMNAVPCTCDAERRADRADCSARTGRSPARPARRSARTDGSVRLGAGHASPGDAGVTAVMVHTVDGATTAATSGRPRPRGRRRRRSCGRARSRRPRRPRASAPRSRAARGSSACRGSESSPSQSPWKPTRTIWSSRRLAGRLERLQVERQVRLEVVVERGPAVTDPAGQPRPAAVSPPMMIGGGATGTG